MAGWVRRLVVSRLLTVLLVITFASPTMVAAAHAHHYGDSIVGVETPVRDTSGAHQETTCLICHVHCGCHVGLPIRELAAGLSCLPVQTSGTFTSDRQRPSAQVTALTRPPKP